MSELLDDARKRKDLLKHMILQLHKGEAPGAVRTQLVRLLGQVPYAEVVEVEQELMAEGMKQEDIIRLCDLHTEALKGTLEQPAVKPIPPGHPIDTFRKENQAVKWELASLQTLYGAVEAMKDEEDASGSMEKIQAHFNALLDVEKHYSRKENLLFPFLEKHGVTGPSKVMWGKHDETRALLKGAMEALRSAKTISAGEAKSLVQLVLRPASKSIEEMIYKEEQILFPMSMDTLSEAEFHEISEGSLEIGYCLYDPGETWKPEGAAEALAEKEPTRIQLPSGSFTAGELNAILNTIPFDLTFVDRDDTVRYFTQGRERIFTRSRAILGRKVQNCHPPSSVQIVERILDDFRSGRQDRAAFWIPLKGRFIHIEYFALRGAGGEYLGTLEVSQDLTEKRKLEGEQRLLTYTGEGG
jgi:DUF438 domain-containing protein